jgi:DNA-binding NarL/FixJ family response regulator
VPKGAEPPHLLGWALPQDPPARAVLPRLSPSERAVLEDAANGLTVLESATSRLKSPETVKSQRRTLMVKLGARNMTHAVAIATQERMLTIERAA